MLGSYLPTKLRPISGPLGPKSKGGGVMGGLRRQHRATTPLPSGRTCCRWDTVGLTPPCPGCLLDLLPLQHSGCLHRSQRMQVCSVALCLLHLSV